MLYEPKHPETSAAIESLDCLDFHAGIKDRCAVIDRAIDTALAALSSSWIKCSDQMPKPGISVLAFVQAERDDGKLWTRRIRAQYAAEGTLEAADEEEGVYDEKRDAYFVAPGWYETNEYEEIHWCVHDPVTHWMPLPEPPTV